MMTVSELKELLPKVQDVATATRARDTATESLAEARSNLPSKGPDVDEPYLVRKAFALLQKEPVAAALLLQKAIEEAML